MTQTILFINTQSNENNHIYDLSFSVYSLNKSYSSVKFDKTLRNRRIYNTNEILKPMFNKNYLIYENSHKIPIEKRTNYMFYADYTYATFRHSLTTLKYICDIYKPNIIIGNNLNDDICNIRNTQSQLKTNDSIYMENEKLPSYKLFKKHECQAFDNAYKIDINLYIKNHCPNFMKCCTDFCNEFDIELQYNLCNMYRYAIMSPNIEQLHIGFYDIEFMTSCLTKAIKMDGMKYFPQHCIKDNKRKYTDIDNSLKRKFSEI